MRESPDEHIRNAMQLVLSLSYSSSESVHDQLTAAITERLQSALDELRAERRGNPSPSIPRIRVW